MLIAIALLAPLLAATLLVLGLRGRRTDDHPLCRRCGYDLTGRSADTTRCNECGADLARPRAIRLGHRRRQRVPLAFGVASLAVILLVAATLGWDVAHKKNWHERVLRYAPIGYLLSQASSPDQDQRFWPINELWERTLQGRLSDADWARIGSVGLAYQGDLSKPWDPSWGYLLETARATGHLSDADWRRYARQAWASMFRLDVRPMVRRGDALPFALCKRGGRVAFRSVLQLDHEDPVLAWADRPRPSKNTRGTSNRDTIEYDGESIYVDRLPPDQFPPGLPDGVQRVHATATVRVGTVDARGVLTPLDAGTADVSATFTLVPADHPTVQMVRDPALTEVIRRSIRLKFFHGRLLELNVDGTPIGLSFDVFLRRPGVPDLNVGTFTRAAAPANSTMMTGLQHWPTLPHGTTIDVVFRGNPAAATDSVDVTRAWDGELVYRGLVIP